jgi:sec-independent protein translocase protein TatC
VMLAGPMLLLFVVAEVVAKFMDKARGRGAYSTEQWGDDQQSPL